MRTPHDPGSADPADRAAVRLAQLAAAIDGGPSVPAESADAAEVQPWWADHTRVAARPVTPAPVQDPAPAPGAATSSIPEPGRHASRRREPRLGPAVRARMPAVGPVSPQHLALVALAVAVVIGATAWWLLRDRGSVEAISPASSSAPLVGASLAPAAESGGSGGPTARSPAGGSATGSAGAAANASVTVDVVGKVRHPGIVVLEAGARVVDAIKGAGGARRGVDLSSLNLARVLVDGEQIAVGAPGATPGAAAGPSAVASGTAGPGTLVNLNTATEEQLEALPEVGPVTAQAIIAWRDQNGGFTSVDQLTEVQGIGDKTLAELGPYVTV